MAVTKILIRLTTLAPQPDVGTADNLYVGVITKTGGREFPLRYQRGGLKINAGQTLEFGVNANDLPAEKQIFESTGNGRNSIETFPLSQVESVYLRKAAANASFDRDDAVGIEYVGVFITEVTGGEEVLMDWNNRNRPDSSGPSPFWLGSEFGQTLYLKLGG